MDKLKEEYKGDFEFLDWLKSLPIQKRKEFLSKSDLFEDGNDPSVIHLAENETVEDWIEKYNLHDANELIERFSEI